MTSSSGVALSADRLIDRAVTAAGSDDFGIQTWRDGLDILASANDEADLNEVGRQILEAWVEQRLVNRQNVVAWAAEHADLVAAQQIEPPMVVVGVLRTGTTMLSELLACDPHNRPLMKWEALDVIPPPTAVGFHSDPRIARMVAEVEATYAMVPKPKSVHFEPGTAPPNVWPVSGKVSAARTGSGCFRCLATSTGTWPATSRRRIRSSGWRCACCSQRLPVVGRSKRRGTSWAFLPCGRPFLTLASSSLIAIRVARCLPRSR